MLKNDIMICSCTEKYFNSRNYYFLYDAVLFNNALIKTRKHKILEKIKIIKINVLTACVKSKITVSVQLKIKSYYNIYWTNQNI